MLPSFMLVALSIGVFLSACGDSDAEIVFSNALTEEAKPTITSTITPSPTSTSTSTPTPTSTNTFTPEPTNTPTLPPLIEDDHGISMVLVPAGPFIMGIDFDESASEQATEQSDDELVNFVLGLNAKLAAGPSHSVTLGDYYIDKFEVTNAQYAECVNAELCGKPRGQAYGWYNDWRYEDSPVWNVTWDDANNYCEFRDTRLPTEAEWEKAARGTEGWDYPWGYEESPGFDIEQPVANFCDFHGTCIWSIQSDHDDGFNLLAPVGSYPNGASPYGAMDMAGNVAEWVADWFDVYPEGDPTADDEFGETHRVVRGGSFSSLFAGMQTWYRDHWEPDTIMSDWVYYQNIGFRCVRDTSRD